MGDFVALALAGSAIMGAVYFSHLDPTSWPVCTAVMGAAGIACLAYFWLTGDDL